MSARAAHVLSRRRLLAGAGAAAVVALGGVAAYEMVEAGLLPGKYRLDALLGYCELPRPRVTFGPSGTVHSGTFFSHYRTRSVGYSIAFPAGRGPGDQFPLLMYLHGFGGSHRDGLGWPLATMPSMIAGGKPLPPMGIVTVDGGPGYWNPHPEDDPFGMLIHEVIPMCRARGLGHPDQGIAVMGLSMGGYGALLMAEKRPDLVRAVAAISPAIWTSYSQARDANSLAYASATAFAANDVVTHTSALRHIPVRVAVGLDDPFLSGVKALKPELPPGKVVIISKGCHGGDFFLEQVPPSLAFVSRYLGSA